MDEPQNSTENGFNANEHKETSLEQEKKREYEILNEVLGKHQLIPKINRFVFIKKKSCIVLITLINIISVKKR